MKKLRMFIHLLVAMLPCLVLTGCSDHEEEYPKKVMPTEEVTPITASRLQGTISYSDTYAQLVLNVSREDALKHIRHLGNEEEIAILLSEEYEIDYQTTRTSPVVIHVWFTGTLTYQYMLLHNPTIGPYTHVYSFEPSEIILNDGIDRGEQEVAQLKIETENGAPIVGKEKEHYVNCTVTIDAYDNPEWNYEGTGRIRGRGNSTWKWYPKKPYRIKLDKKASILGMKEEKDWVLLANYRDPTHMMNTFVFVAGQEMGLPYTNHNRYVEVTLNGEYIGLYQLTEQVEQGSSRVAVEDEGGMLISLDADDGPDLAPDAGDNFWSSVYQLPICVKHPEDQTPEQLTAIQSEFALLEQAIKSSGYAEVQKLLDTKSFIDYLLIQELVYNVEVDAPRSIYMHKEKGGKWMMGPLWDFDAGYDFDWSTMYTGHNYFMSYRELVLGSDPVNHTGGYRVPNFFTDLFKNRQFVHEYKRRWTEIKEKVMTAYWAETEKYIDATQEAMQRDAIRWPIDKSYSREIERMKEWLRNRVTYLDTIINNYPAGTK